MRFRVGTGFDSHRLQAGDHIVIGGVAVPGTVSAVGHSDADVLLHALTDALLGAIAASDIGEHFSDSEPAWCGAPSSTFVKAALARIRENGYRVVNVDSTLILDRPKLGPYKRAMAENMAALLGIGVDAVSVKAKTSEGFDPRDQGVAAQVVVLLEGNAEKAKTQND